MVGCISGFGRVFTPTLALPRRGREQPLPPLGDCKEAGGQASPISPQWGETGGGKGLILPNN